MVGYTNCSFMNICTAPDSIATLLGSVMTSLAFDGIGLYVSNEIRISVELFNSVTVV